MASKSKRLRDDYVAGYGIVTLDGEHPVIYVPRSCLDKSPWVRADGFPFRYHAGELKSIGTKATNDYTARKAAERKPTAAQIIAGDRYQRAQRPDYSDAYDSAETALRAAGELDPHWYRM